MSRKSLLMVAAAVVSVAVMSSAQGAVADSRFESVPIVLELGPNAAPIVRDFRLDESVDSISRDGAVEHSAIAKAGLWDGIKKIGGAIKKGAQAVGGAVVKRVVVGTGKNLKQLLAPVGRKIKAAGKVLVEGGKEIYRDFRR